MYKVIRTGEAVKLGYFSAQLDNDEIMFSHTREINFQSNFYGLHTLPLTTVCFIKVSKVYTDKHIG